MDGRKPPNATARRESGRGVIHEQRDETWWNSWPREPDRPDPAEYDRGRVRTPDRHSGSPGRVTSSIESNDAVEIESTPRSTSGVSPRPRVARVKQTKPRRVQRMFAIEEDLDKKLWLYAIHLGKDRSEVVNDLLRPIVASMVLYDSRDRRSGRSIEATPERGIEADGDTSA